jgi:hypothetical protein
VWKCYNNKLAQAWQVWNTQGDYVYNQVRLNVLAREFTERQLKQITWSQLKMMADERKAKRLNKLRAYLKAWKEHRSYTKYFLNQKNSLQRLRQQLNQNTLKMCFNALR